jgi:hypothetical protein
MKKYEVEWRKHGSTNAEYAHQFEASNFEDAWEKASTKHLYGECDYLYVECTNSKVMKRFGNPHHSAYVPPHRTAREKTSHQQHSQQSAPTDSSPRQPIISIGSPRSSSWATLYRVCGGIFFFVGLIGTIAVAQKNEEAGFQLAVMAIALTLTSFLFAFLIDVLTDMRHYLKRIAEKS